MTVARKADVTVGQKVDGATVAGHDEGYYGTGWSDEAGLWQVGSCRNEECEEEGLVSWAKHAICPSCGREAYLT